MKARYNAVAIVLLCVFNAMAASRSLRDELGDLLRSSGPSMPGPPVPAQSSPPQVSLADDGFVRYIGASQGHEFPVANAALGQPELIARNFLKQHGRLFGVSSPAVDFATLKNNNRNGRNYLRFQQTYGGLPVFAAQVTVQLNAQDGVECIFADIERNTQPFDDRHVALVPILTAAQASERAKVLMAPEANGDRLDTKPPELVIFSPSVVDEPGKPRVVWDVVVFSVASHRFGERVLIDSRSGELVFRYPLIHQEIDRRIHDDTNQVVGFGPVIRGEGDPPAAEPQVNAAYDYIGATYLFYLHYHGRQDWQPYYPEVDAIVRYCPGGSDPCPWNNASYSSVVDELRFGDGWATDDVVAHEYTHGITTFESGLIYRNTPGAINESFSDIWGEFVDLLVVYSNDVASARWLVSEDVPGGPIRSMKDPTLFNNPDRLNSPLYVPPVPYPGPDDDNGGVHSNSGVLNKFCYLLTDGDYFNGYNIAGMGIARVADLFYELNANLLQSAPDWGDVYDALRQAALNLGWTKLEQDNLCRAALAVEIAVRPRNFYADKNSLGCLNSGSQICTLFGGPFISIAQGVNGICPGDNLWVRTGSYNEKPTIARSLTLRPYDGPVSIGKP